MGQLLMSGSAVLYPLGNDPLVSRINMRLPYEVSEWLRNDSFSPVEEQNYRLPSPILSRFEVRYPQDTNRFRYVTWHPDSPIYQMASIGNSTVDVNDGVYGILALTFSYELTGEPNESCLVDYMFVWDDPETEGFVHAPNPVQTLGVNPGA